MPTLKSILKKKPTSPNKTKKRVLINPNFNQIAEDNPEPITEASKHERWSTGVDVKMNREQLKKSASRFAEARRQSPAIAAKTARRKYKIPSPDPLENSIHITRRDKVNPIPRPRARPEPVPKPAKSPGLISRMYNSAKRFFGKKGGRKTRKNKRNV